MITGPTKPREVGYWVRLGQRDEERGEEKMGRSRTTANLQRLHTFMGIATVLWLVGAVAAVIDGDGLMALS